MKECLSAEELAKDLCDWFEDVDYNFVLSRINALVDSSLYTLEELWEINNEDSTKMYDLIF